MKSNAPIMLAVSLGLFIAAIYTVRYVDRTRYTAISDEMKCEQGEVLMLDMRREFVCLPGSKPING